MANDRAAAKRGLFAAGLALFGLLAVSAVDSWLISRDAIGLLSLVCCSAGALVSAAVCAKGASAGARAAVVVWLAALLTVGALDSLCDAVRRASTPAIHPPAAAAGHDAVTAWARQHGVEVLFDDASATVLGRAQGWAWHWRGVGTTLSCADISRTFTDAARASLGLAQGASCRELVAQLRTRWPRKVFTLLVWRPGSSYGEVLEASDDNRLGPLGVYPQNPLLSDLLAPSQLADRARGYANLIRFLFAPLPSDLGPNPR